MTEFCEQSANALATAGESSAAPLDDLYSEGMMHFRFLGGGTSLKWQKTEETQIERMTRRFVCKSMASGFQEEYHELHEAL